MLFWAGQIGQAHLRVRIACIDMKWSRDIEQADWWLGRLGTWGADGIRSLVPAGFASITRVFHPVELPSGETTTWTALAQANSKVAHAEMQLHTIAAPSQAPLDPARHEEPYAHEGELPPQEMNALASELARWTTTPDRCWFGVWAGYGNLHGGRAVGTLTRLGRIGRYLNRCAVEGLAPQEVRESPPVRAPGRDYLLLHGALAAIGEAASLLGRQSPNIWWPHDQA
ncbi:MAG: hypothetical protein GY745_14000, partial [Actinomycetia bacterium]|nr:hypothetical protein [Actinomycetes bacterium]